MHKEPTSLGHPGVSPLPRPAAPSPLPRPPRRSGAAEAGKLRSRPSLSCGLVTGNNNYGRHQRHRSPPAHRALPAGTGLCCPFLPLLFSSLRCAPLPAGRGGAALLGSPRRSAEGSVSPIFNSPEQSEHARCLQGTLT